MIRIKQILGLIGLTVLLLGFSQWEARAQVSKYKLWICGKQVTSENLKNISAFPGCSGTIQYNPTTKQLILLNANIAAADGESAVKSEIDGFVIFVSDDSSIVGTGGAAAVDLAGSTTIKGIAGRRLSIINNGALAVYLDETVWLTVSNTCVAIEGLNGGIAGDANTHVNVVDSYLSVKATNSNPSVTAVEGLSGFQIEKCDFLDGASTENGFVFDNLGNKAKEFVIGHQYFYYNNFKVTDLNRENFGVALCKGSKGKAEYIPWEKKIVFSKFEVNRAKMTHGLQESAQSIGKIELQGANDSYVSNGAFQLQGTVVIEGTGSLKIRDLVLSSGATIHLKGDQVSVTTDLVQKSSMGNEKRTLIVNGATLTLVGDGSEPTLSGIDELRLQGGSIITEPQGAHFDKSKKGIVDSKGNLIKGKVVITCPVDYGFSIAGVQINSQTVKTIASIPGVTGKIRYNHSKRTLTLENAKIASTAKDVRGIYVPKSSKIADFALELIGENAVKTGYASVSLGKPARIYGGGKLSCETAQGAALFAVDLHIEDCKLSLVGDQGLYGGLDALGKVSIRNAHVEATGSKYSVGNFAEISLTGEEIVSPEGAVYDAKRKGIVDSKGELIKSKVVIAPLVAPTSIAVEPQAATVNVGETVALSATVSPAEASQVVKWTSEDNGIATVDGASGVVTGVAAGSVKITATTKDGTQSASATVTVEDPNAPIEVSGVSLSETSKSLKVGESFTLSATVSPEDATDKTVSWASSDKTVATVDASGLVTAKRPGTTSITVTTKDGGKKADCTVTVVKDDETPITTAVDNAVDAQLCVSPNPVEGQMQIVGLCSKAQVRVYAVTGALVLSREVRPAESIDISFLPTGVYLARVGSVTLRFVKR